MTLLARLFIEFFQIGLFSVGGGLATLPFLYSLADRTGWFASSRIADMLAVSESTPGAIGVNMATYTGFSHSGVIGALTATAGLVLPSLVIIILIARVLEAFKRNETVKAVFRGLRPAAVGLIAAAGSSVILLALYDGAASEWYARLRLKEALLFLAVWAGIWKLKLHPVAYIAAAAAAGMVLGLG